MPKEKEKIIYSPTKQYTWNPEDVFAITGKDFGLLLNTVRAILSTEAAAHIRLAIECNTAIDNLLKTNVEAGKIKEVVAKEGEATPLIPPKMKVVK